MRILHTSDWHLGRSFHGEDLLAAQAAYVDHLIETVEAEQVDLVVVSGDVYDRALPSVDAVALADDALHRLGHLAGPGRDHLGQPRLRPAPRLQRPAGRPRRRAPAHRRRPRRRAGAARGRARPGRGLRHPLPRARRAHRGVGAAHPLAPRGARPRRCERIRADLATRPAAPARWCWPTPSSPAGCPSESERDIAVGGISVVPARALRRHRLHRPRPPARPGDPERDRCATAGRRSPTRSPRPTTSRARGWSTSTPTASTQATFVAGPGRPAARPARGHPRRPAHRRRASPRTRTSWVQATLTDDRPARARRWSGCAPVSRTPWRCGSRRAVASARRSPS